jgi:hypothetical protein
MPGKYSSYRNELQRRPMETIDFGDKILLKKAELAQTLDKAGIARRLKEIKIRKTEISREDKSLNLEFIALKKLLVDYLEPSGEEKFTLTEGGTFSLGDKLYPFVKDQAALREWAKKNGYEKDLRLHNKTLESIVGDRLINGGGFPDGVDVFIDVDINMRGVVPKDLEDEDE